MATPNGLHAAVDRSSRQLGKEDSYRVAQEECLLVRHIRRR